MIPGKVSEQLILEIIFKHMNDKMMLWSSHHEFMKVKTCFTNLTDFYKVIVSVDEREQCTFFTLRLVRMSPIR